MTNPHLSTSHNWYIHELQTMFPNAKEIKASRGYSFKVDGILYDCSDNNPKNWHKKRLISLANAKAKYVHRYTMEYVPEWAKKPHFHTEYKTNKYYAPQYRSDKEWYENTIFPGESPMCLASDDHCYSSGPTWPLGQWLDKPYVKQA